MMFRPALALFALLLLGACGFRPLYSGGPQGNVGQTLSRIAVAPIAGEAGWLVRGALRDRLSVAGDGGNAAYRLDVRLDESIAGYGVRRDDSVTRERRTLRARWQLVDTANGQTVIDDTAGTDVGIDVVGSEYATIAAERSALERMSATIADQIVARIAEQASGIGVPAAPTTTPPAPSSTTPQ